MSKLSCTVFYITYIHKTQQKYIFASDFTAFVLLNNLYAKSCIKQSIHFPYLLIQCSVMKMSYFYEWFTAIKGDTLINQMLSIYIILGFVLALSVRNDGPWPQMGSISNIMPVSELKVAIYTTKTANFSMCTLWCWITQICPMKCNVYKKS